MNSYKDLDTRKIYKDELIYLIGSNRRSGRHELIYKLYSEYIDNMSYHGAAEFITKDLGLNITWHTTRAVRSKNFKQKVKDETLWEEKKNASITDQKEFNELETNESFKKKREVLKAFKPLDLFDPINTIKSSENSVRFLE